MITIPCESPFDEHISSQSTPLLMMDNDPAALAQLRDVAESIIFSDQLPLTVRTFSTPQQMETAIDAAGGHCLCMIDILMDNDAPGGMQLARRLRERKLDVDIVFVTSSPDYAMEGYEVYASGYLLKPVAPAALRRLLDHLLSARRMTAQTLELVSERVKLLIPVMDICYVDVYGKNSYVHMTDRVITTSMRLKDLFRRLPKDHFLQCHRSSVVNLAHVRAALADHLLMDNGDRVPIRVRESLPIRSRCAEYLWRNMPATEV